MSENENREKLERNVKLLFWHSFFGDFSFWAPIAILYFAKISGSYALGLSVLSIAMVSSAFFEVPTGIFSDMIGRRKTLILGALGFLLSMIVYAAAGNYVWLCIGAILEGIGRSFYSGNNDALLYDSLAAIKKNDDFNEHYGKMGSMSQWALGISGLVGGVLAAITFKLAVWLSVIPMVVCLFLGLFLTDVEEVKVEDENIFNHLGEAIKGFIHNPRLRTLSLINILSFGMSEASFQFRSAFVATLWPVWAIGIAQVLSNIGAALSFHFSGRLIKKFKALTWMLAGGIYSRVVHFIALLFPGILSPALMSSTSIFYGVGETAKKYLLQQEFTVKQRATMGSLNSLGGSLFFGLFAVLLGAVADRIGPAKALLSVQFLQLGIIFMNFRLFMRDRQLSVS